MFLLSRAARVSTTLMAAVPAAMAVAVVSVLLVRRLESDLAAALAEALDDVTFELAEFC